MSLSAPICATCATQYPEGATPESCAICEDPRQYVAWGGQKWTSLRELRDTHRNEIAEVEPGLYSIHPVPDLGINQRAYLVQTPEGNLLWDCVALIDDATVAEVRRLGGVRAIAISHPHYYSTMAEWSREFEAPIHLHELDREWVMRPADGIRFWRGDCLALFGGLKLVLTGGHFDGFQVLHWPAGANGRGALLAGDQPQVAMDRRWVSFLWSYPNMVPLGAGAVTRIVETLRALEFDRIHGAFGRSVERDAKRALKRSADRYLKMISD